MQQNDRASLQMRQDPLFDQCNPGSGPIISLCVPVHDRIALAADLVGGATGGSQIATWRTEEPQTRIVFDALDDVRRLRQAFAHCRWFGEEQRLMMQPVVEMQRPESASTQALGQSYLRHRITG